MAPRAPLLSICAVASALAGAAAVDEVRNVPAFTGVSVSGAIQVHARVNSSTSSSSLRLSGSPDAISGVVARVDLWGTLLLNRHSGTGRVVANVTVPGPLTFAGAVSGSSLAADAVTGTVVASGQSRIDVKSLASPNSISISASSHSSVGVASGRTPWLTASCSDWAAVDLGSVQADRGSVSVSAGSSLTGGTVGSATITVTGNSLLTMRATRSVGLSCEASEVHLSGGARVVQYSNWECIVGLFSAQAPAVAEAIARKPAQEEEEEAAANATGRGPRRLASAAVYV